MLLPLSVQMDRLLPPLSTNEQFAITSLNTTNNLLPPLSIMNRLLPPLSVLWTGCYLLSVQKNSWLLPLQYNEHVQYNENVVQYNEHVVQYNEQAATTSLSTMNRLLPPLCPMNRLLLPGTEGQLVDTTSLYRRTGCHHLSVQMNRLLPALSIQ